MLSNIIMGILVLLVLGIIHYDSKPKQQQQQIQYPVFMGYNGITIREDVVGDYFKKLEKYFEINYFEYAQQYSNNVIYYRFKVYNQLNPNFQRERMLSILRRIGEQALTSHFHQQGVHNLNADHFIAVQWQADTLYYFIATNDAGLNEILQLRKTH